MIATGLTEVNTWLNVAMLLALVLAVIIVGKSKAKDSTIAAQTAELDAREKTEERLRAEVKELGIDLIDGRTKCAEDIAKLGGQVQQLTNQNTTLQSLVMGTTVPDALRLALQENAIHVSGEVAQNRKFYEQLIDEKLRPIEQGLSRLLTAGGKEG